MEILSSEDFDAWLKALAKSDRHEARSVDKVVELLAIKGLSLPYPWSSALNDTDLALRELRPRRGESPYRVIYGFDPDRNAILLLGGHKEDGIYGRGLRRAGSIFRQHVNAVTQAREISKSKRGK